MLGDFAPFHGLNELLRRFPRLHLYVDDAHAMSWLGLHGRGAALTRLVEWDRVSVAVSLSKAFGAVGGAVAFPTAEARDRVRRCGGPMSFSGPVAPAGLGAGLASAQLHLTPEFENLQAELRERIIITRDALGSAGLPPATADETPIIVLHYDSAQTARAVVAALRTRGFFACVSTFPAVPINKPSVRFTVSRHNSLSDVRAMVDNLVDVSMEVAPSMRRDAPLAAVELVDLHEPCEQCALVGVCFRRRMGARRLTGLHPPSIFEGRR